jgi:hypothetical protein
MFLFFTKVEHSTQRCSSHLQRIPLAKTDLNNYSWACIPISGIFVNTDSYPGG